MTTISVVIPNFNGARWLRTCLDSLLRQTRAADEIVVVDDASADDSVAFVHQYYPQVKLIKRETNGGFCKTANDGLRVARGDLIALLNNDTECDSRWLAELIVAMEANPKIGIGASKLLCFDQRNRVNSAGLFLRVDGVGRDIGFDQPDGDEFSRARFVFGASGGAVIYRRELLEEIGLFDEDFYAYAEDLDLSFRAQLRGWSCLFVPRAIVYHRVGATYATESAIKVYHSSRNMLTVLIKNLPARLWRKYFPLLLAAQIYQVIYFSTRGRGVPALRGKIDALRALRRTLAKRRQIQRDARVSDAQIEAMLSSWQEHRRGR